MLFPPVVVEVVVVVASTPRRVNQLGPPLVLEHGVFSARRNNAAGILVLTTSRLPVCTGRLWRRKVHGFSLSVVLQSKLRRRLCKGE